MLRRNFMSRLIGVGAGVCGMNRKATPSVSIAESCDALSEPCKGNQYSVLSKALDRSAMQRGWARDVSPDYHHCPDAAIECFKDLKFGTRIHWGLYCLIGSHESWGLAGANQEFWNHGCPIIS